jgi:flavin-dependent dehydrogenase
MGLNMKTNFDVIVIGGRCSGASVSMLLARAGYRVLLLDKMRFPSSTLSTHMLKPRAMGYMQRWGLRDALAEVTPIHNEFVFMREGIRLMGAPTAAALTKRMQEVHGDEGKAEDERIEIACVKRNVLDQILVSAAEDAGAEVRQECTVEGLLRDGDKVTGVVLRTPTGIVEERARLVIGADGRHSQTRKWVDAPVQAVSDQCTYTVYSYYEGISYELSRPGVCLTGRLGVGLGETNDGHTMISVFGPSEWFGEFRSDMEGNLSKTVDLCYPALGEAMRESGKRVDRLYGTTDLSNVMRKAYGNGWLLLGDAACHLDQCTAIGITHAFRDAALAGEWVGKGLSGELPMETALERYAQIRDAEMRTQFDYVSTVSECRIPTIQQMGFYAAMQTNEDALSRFLGFGASIVPRSEYFTDAEMLELVSAGSERAPAEQDWNKQVLSHQQNPWLAA